MSTLLRAGAIMAVGTMASRVSGFVRTIVLAAAIGVGALSDAYTTAYIIPFILFDLLLNGILSSVVVPMVVRAQKRDPDGGRAYEQRLLTLVTLILITVSVLGVLAAGPLIDLYGQAWTSLERDVATTLARFILPQIAFFGVGALAGAFLNTRERFGAPVWAPVLNNVVVIGVAVTYLLVSEGGTDIAAVTPGDLRLLGIGTTAGIVLQAVALVISLHRVGFRFRPRFDFHNARLGEMGRTAVWTFAYVVIVQAGFMVVANVGNAAGAAARKSAVGHEAGFSIYNYSYQLFQFPYALIAVSVITALLPRMSALAADGRLDSVREEFSSGLRLVCAAIVPAGMLLLVLGAAITVPLYHRGGTSLNDAIYMGNVLQVFGLALVPFSIFQMLLRIFYALGDTRTPALIAVANVAVLGGLGLIAYEVLPPGMVVMGIALAFALSYVCGTGCAWFLLSRRLGGLDGWRFTSVLAKQHVAAVPAVLIAFIALWIADATVGLNLVSSILVLVVGGGLGGLAYLGTAHRMRIPEVSSIVGMVAARLRPGA
ncbi:murein biosynthesis integral membrane protein MurJ [Rhizohabitans arisaemae]|uniref:murein biosynthesis integral membrane protein MurJ n=1 Tax=Rhizohabitans arisaemae TaxID=2720610 RepID=UPI0024B15E47|nr:murein biosynthesis integral membrane protein MurJ [Rhizohabitans arisaemae]